MSEDDNPLPGAARRVQEQLAAGNTESALASAEHALLDYPNEGSLHVLKGLVLKALGRLSERIDCYRRALLLAPADAYALANLGAALSEAGAHGEAESCARAALVQQPGLAAAWYNLGNALLAQGRWREAEAAYARADGIPPPYLALARLHGREQRRDEAARAYRQRLQQDPNDPAALTELGNTWKSLGDPQQALAMYRRVAALEPGRAEAYGNLGAACHALGRHGEATSLYRRCLELDASLAPVWSNLAGCLNSRCDQGPQQVRAVLDEFDRTLCRPLFDPRPHRNDPEPERVLRIGYVSPDFRRHVVAGFALPLIEGHSRSVEAWCYHNHHREDDWSEGFKAATRRWRNVSAMDDAAFAERVREDGIDILVDLAGHSEGNRLLAFARKPAPVQVTHLGYVISTGLSAMDWRLSHADADPPGSDADYTEKLWRLPGAMWCWRPLPGMPDVTPLPCASRGRISFGVFNRYAKVTPETLACWAEILSRLPDSRLVMCAPEGAARRDVRQHLARHGVAGERVEVFAMLDQQAFWALHGEVDIALDPFPFNGGATSYETLWLGLPLISCAGGAGSFAPRYSSRIGRHLLNTLGLPELATADEAGYVAAAVSLARDPGRLAEIRAGLRPRMAASPLLDATRSVAEIEQAYRGMWRLWCTQSRAAT